ncbi:uncharacterized protein NDAI_0A05200 [Naumovozyma dairenensis CBS 421]|uniref:Uncharacterized protein n=1 Tax=Naumovozyma dairenensis (strain ATCC 10597 / BCRC 20456 / CBS 421 / NBRC 0211 / NRRL Y-12639) TaxID=1071378 RepID=G0W4D7_NAUDC|nr:hypothetical protein NDAI_0A05200 [Naumovozyma dairenensis CBS 421]CCD22675.1 hypothetical protein NDAI_0A05200 [Naumovozyma dairenensis CBS 421]
MPLNNVKRPDLCVKTQYIAPPKGLYSTLPSVSGLVNQSMPMIAMFLRNKFIAWFALIQCIHYYLNTDEEEVEKNKTKENASPLDQSPLIKVLMSTVGLITCYLNLAFPQADLPPPKKPVNVETVVQETEVPITTK